MTLQYFTVSGVISTAFESSAPAFADVLSALQQQRISRASWVGPAPRVVRRAQPSLTAGYTTYVTWILQVDVVTFAPGLVQSIQDTISALLEGVVSGWTVTVQPYSQAVNGPLSWWQDGSASQTHTSTSFPASTLAASLQPEENPYGPDSAATRPATPGEGLQPLAQGASSLLTKAAVVGGIGLALYLAWPLLMGARESAQTRRKPTVHANPRRRRRRHRRTGFRI